MSQAKGKLITCDICGAPVFLKTTGEGEADGGYTRWNEFEAFPEGWASSKIQINNRYIDSCPKCSARYDELMEKAIAELKGMKEREENA